MFQQIQKVLQKEAIMKHKYKEEIEKANKSLQRVMDSQMPLHIKERMMDSIRFLWICN